MMKVTMVILAYSIQANLILDIHSFGRFHGSDSSICAPGGRALTVLESYGTKEHTASAEKGRREAKGGEGRESRKKGG